MVASNPVALLDTVTPEASEAPPVCEPYGQAYEGELLALAFNADGSRNSCANPASPGALVTIFLAGLGVTSPAPITGSINPNPAVPLNFPVTAPGFTVASASAPPGWISGVWEVQLEANAAATGPGAIPLSLSVAAVPARDTPLVIWVR